MLVAPGPIEVVQTMARWRRSCLAKAIAACAIALLVVRAIGRQRVPRAVQRLAEAGDIAVAENRPHAGEIRDLARRRSRRTGWSQRTAACAAVSRTVVVMPPASTAARAARQASTSADSRAAIVSTASSSSIRP